MIFKISSYKKKGTHLLNKGEYLEAIKNFDKAIEINAEDHESWNLIGVSKFNLKKY